MRSNFLIASLLLAGLTASAGAQSKSPVKPADSGKRPAAESRERPAAEAQAPTLTPSDPTAIEFAEEPLKLPSVGLSIRCPVGVASQVDSAGRDSTLVMVPKEPTWSLKIRTPRTTDLDATIESVAETTLESLFDSYGINAAAKQAAMESGKLLREPAKGQTLKVAGYDCCRWFIELPSLEGKTPQVRGLSVIRCSPGQFVIFELLTTKPNFLKAKAVADTIMATTAIEDPAKLQAGRSAAVTAGVKLIDSLGSQALHDIVTAMPVRWERRYMPGASGTDKDAREVAYRRVKFSYGPRNALEGAPGAATKASGNRTEGFIVQIDARILGKDGAITDSRSVYFMSPDRSEETWVVTNSLRAKAGAEPVVVTETGARTEQSMVVRSEGKGIPPETHKPIMQGDGYLCQVETFMLPFLLMKSGAEVEHGFYAWNSAEAKIVLRKDLPGKVSIDAGKQGWKISTQVVEGRKPMEGYYDDASHLMRIDMPDGSVWEPTTYEELVRIWKSKGLPTG
jgi:hypothetical protein